MTADEVKTQILALHTLVAALIETHPEPDRLIFAINQLEGMHLTAALSSPQGSALFRGVSESLERARVVIRARIAAQSSPPKPD